jgi:hypothetical protein
VSSRPVVPGFYPDPTVCRVGDDYYLATSSFEYAPGVPLFRSTDLLSWTQVGNVLDRPSQLTVAGGLAGASRGIYAPTLRHHDGRFWMVTTDVGRIDDGHLLVHAADPAGPWSEPAFTAGAVGIDPDLAWDGPDCYLTWKREDGGGIWQALLDPETGRLLSEPRLLWTGTGLAQTEGPHLLRRGRWWYLVVAEGGTGRGHAVSVARSERPSGPFAGCPANPVLSHRSLDGPVQSTGHGDLVERQDGTWAMLYLGVRPAGSPHRFHVNGRETFLAGVDWVDDWPVVDEDRFDVPAARTSFVDRFAEPELDPRWVSPGRHPGEFAAPGPAGLELAPGRAPVARVAERMLAVRTRDERWTAVVRLARGDAAVVVRIDDAHWAGVERVGDQVLARAVVGDLDQVLDRAVAGTGEVDLLVRAVPATGERRHRGPDRLELGLVVDGRPQVLAGIDGRYVSTEVAGGFTGRVLGVEALRGPAVVRSVTYAAEPADPAS